MHSVSNKNGPISWYESFNNHIFYNLNAHFLNITFYNEFLALGKAANNKKNKNDAKNGKLLAILRYYERLVKLKSKKLRKMKVS